MPAPQELADAVETRSKVSLAGQVPLYTVHRGRVPSKPDGAYVVLYFGAGAPYGRTLGGTNTHLRWSFRAVCAGASDNEALGAVAGLRARLLGWRPFGHPGPQFVEVDNDPPLLRDDSVPSDIRFSLTLTYRLHTTRS